MAGLTKSLCAHNLYEAEIITSVLDYADYCIGMKDSHSHTSITSTSKVRHEKSVHSSREKNPQGNSINGLKDDVIV